MNIEYVFESCDRVYAAGKYGEITGMVPGNGSIPWYYIKFEDGSEDRFTADEIERA